MAIVNILKNKIKLKLGLIVLGVVAIVAVTYCLLAHFVSFDNVTNDNITGVVEEIYYDCDGNPSKYKIKNIYKAIDADDFDTNGFTIEKDSSIVFDRHSAYHGDSFRTYYVVEGLG